MTRSILVLMDDLFLIPSVEDAAHKVGLMPEFISDPAELGITSPDEGSRGTLTEPLEGAGAELVRHISALRPSLIVVDATLQHLPWAVWIQVLKTSAATMRIPILVFGPHVEHERLDLARNMGADEVVTRGHFHKQMASLLEQNCLPDTSYELGEACQGVLSEKARLGIQQHNQGAYYEAHELFESAWMEASESEGSLYRALLQYSVSLLHITRSNLRGASKMMLRIHQWLDPLPEDCRGVDVARLRSDVADLRARLLDNRPPGDLTSMQIRLLS